MQQTSYKRWKLGTPAVAPISCSEWNMPHCFLSKSWSVRIGETMGLTLLIFLVSHVPVFTSFATPADFSECLKKDKDRMALAVTIWTISVNQGCVLPPPFLCSDLLLFLWNGSIILLAHIPMLFYGFFIKPLDTKAELKIWRTIFFCTALLNRKKEGKKRMVYLDCIDIWLFSSGSCSYLPLYCFFYRSMP